ncbi:MAG TPA: type II secretion system minor pseudopilin GspI [Gammaproteobacteria bacterium]|nr:type II secretion system minor pseudopilin GspI [Gammaproteobacteria bacterium]
MRRVELVRAGGFTLLEAMVALVIVALGMMAVNGQLNRYVVAASFVEEKTLASWIGTNEITALSVGPTWPAVGTHDEDVEFAQRKWRCHIVVTETDVMNLHRVDVSVSLKDNPERVLDKVSGLVEPPAPAGIPPTHWSIPVVAEVPAQ